MECQKFGGWPSIYILYWPIIVACIHGLNFGDVVSKQPKLRPLQSSVAATGGVEATS